MLNIKVDDKGKTIVNKLWLIKTHLGCEDIRIDILNDINDENL